ncbi:MAG: hypothetical protein U0X20_22930 [Caldilineaceae bacterium]
MFDPTGGSAREPIDVDEATRMQAAHALVMDGRLRRPRYFDGRFLVAADLTREQDYFLTRQADLGRAGGFGVVAGLEVTTTANAGAVIIGRGHGVTPLGELVVLTDPVLVDLLDIPAQQQLNAAFGLSQVPGDVPRNRTGLYVLCLRPVEYTANQIGAYPTSLVGPRVEPQDSEIIEAVAVTVVPYQDHSVEEDMEQRRAELAWRIFVNREQRELPAGVLPLALIALDRGLIKWVDMYLVRREVGAEQRDILGLGIAPRALREAHVLHYNEQINQLAAKSSGIAARLRFAAAECFRCLPPVGQLPAAAIDKDFTQVFFPPEINVDLSIVPADEVPALVDEALLLPPIDLTLRGDDQESTSVLVLATVPREQFFQLTNDLAGALTRDLRPAAVGLVATRKPLEILRGIYLPSARLLPVPIDPAATVDAAWKRVLAANDMVWYVRRRNLNYAGEVIGPTSRVTPAGAPAPFGRAALPMEAPTSERGGEEAVPAVVADAVKAGTPTVEVVAETPAETPGEPQPRRRAGTSRTKKKSSSR